MKKFLLLCVLPALFIGCVPKSELEKAQGDLAKANQELQTERSTLAKDSDKTPSEFFGLWRCQTTLAVTGLFGGTEASAVEVNITLGKQSGSLVMTRVNHIVVESFVGPWSKSGDFLVIEGAKGFAVFKVASKSDTKMTLLSRTGIIVDFTKIR